MPKVILPEVWAKECDAVAEEAWSDSMDLITEKMQDACFARFLAFGPANDREEKLSDMIFDRVFKRFGELARGK